jgi:CHASE3 domain sensor protein
MPCARASPDAESAQRGFLLTGDPKQSLLSTLRAGPRSHRGWSRPKKLCADNVSHLRRIDLLEGLVARRIALLEEGIQIRRENSGRLPLGP